MGIKKKKRKKKVSSPSAMLMPLALIMMTRVFLRTLEYLIKHLAHLATFSEETNMHIKNLAIVWAPNLLR